jgi:hypothetical protein
MLFNQIKTPSQLKVFVENGPTDSYFFSPDTMRFWGDTMRNYGVRWHDKEAGILELYRRRAVNGGLDSSAYFTASEDGESARRVFLPTA